MPTPILQIVHISDLHFHVGPAPQHDALIRQVIRKVSVVSSRFGRWLLHYWEDGRAGHATDALVAFECFLTGQPLPTEPAGAGPYASAIHHLGMGRVPTWLVDTGDLASVGDLPSVKQAIDWVDALGRQMNVTELVRLYGNHDAWPNKFPLIADAPGLAAHRAQLRQAHFPNAWPDPCRTIAIGRTGHHIDLYGLNSVIHDRNYNTRARGEIANDPHWSGINRDQLKWLRQEVQQRAQGGRKSFRILLTHHPIHHPPPANGTAAPSWTMSLRGASAVANQLHLPGVGPVAHLVLSGHTHELYPRHGALPANAGYAVHSPLGNSQLQLVAGSLTKAVRGGVPAAYDVATEPHQCQILRFYEVPGHPDSLLLRRAVVGRNNGLGRFGFMPVGQTNQPWEDCYLNF